MEKQLHQSFFQHLEISPQFENWLEIRILFGWCSSLTVVLTSEPQLDHFEQFCLVIFKTAEWKNSNSIAISFWILPASYNKWMMAFCSFHRSLILAILWCWTPKMLHFFCQLFVIENAHETILYVLYSTLKLDLFLSDSLYMKTFQPDVSAKMQN